MSAFFGNMMIALRTSISSRTLSAEANDTTSSITATVSGGRGTYTYLWIKSGTACTITTPTAASTTFTGSSVVGTTTVYCEITDTITRNMLRTPSCTITWSRITISGTAVNFTVTANGSVQSRTVITNVQPSGATFSGSVIASGTLPNTYTTSITGTLPNYRGTVQGGTLTILAQPTGSITILDATSTSQQKLRADLTDATATTYSWSRVSGTIASSFTNASSQTATLNATGSGNVTVQCIISYSGGSVTPQTTISFPRPL
jgi:hypothetical protein